MKKTINHLKIYAESFIFVKWRVLFNLIGELDLYLKMSNHF